MIKFIFLPRELTERASRWIVHPTVAYKNSAFNGKSREP
jgi:hypothetical protein